MQVVIFVAGTNLFSNAKALAEAFQQGVMREGVSTNLIRLTDLSINHFSLEYYHPQCSLDDDFCRVQNLIESADGVIIATPIWNFSVPAHLKNFIDRIGGFALDEATHSKGQLNGKPFYLIFTGGAPIAAWKFMLHVTTMHLPQSIKYYGGVVLGRHYEPRCMAGHGKFALVVDKRPESLALLQKKGVWFARIVRKKHEYGCLPWRFRWPYKIRLVLQVFANRFLHWIEP